MTEIRFYHLESQTLDQVLPALLVKALENGHKIIVKTKDEQEAERINTHLWTYNPDSFLPHGTEKDGNKTDQPVWITSTDNNPNTADVLILTQGTQSDQLSDYALVCVMINGLDNDAITNARTRWKSYKEAGYDVTYWQQSAQGGWSKKS